MGAKDASLWRASVQRRDTCKPDTVKEFHHLVKKGPVTQMSIQLSAFRVFSSEHKLVKTK